MTFKCPLCDKEYKNRDSAVKHLLGFHKVDAAKTCNIIYTG